MFYEQLLSRSKQLEEEIRQKEHQLQTFPEGNFFCTQNGNYHKWYLTNGKKHTYIPKKKQEFAEKMAEKKYISLQLEELLQEKKVTDYYLKHFLPEKDKAEELLHNPAYKELLASYFIPKSKEFQEWALAPYEKNPKHPENLIHTATSGNLVRSKSEVMIDLYLYKKQLPFRYEAALSLGGIKIYPDFTILHPKTGNLFYWEHFGMIDDPAYCNHMLSKLQLYISNGIFPTHQLITTYETKNVPLNPKVIQQTVEHYFC